MCYSKLVQIGRWWCFSALAEINFVSISSGLSWLRSEIILVMCCDMFLKIKYDNSALEKKQHLELLSHVCLMTLDVFRLYGVLSVEFSRSRRPLSVF